MKFFGETLRIATRGPGLYDFSAAARAVVHKSGVADGLATCFIRHTSASLVIQENADHDGRLRRKRYANPAFAASSFSDTSGRAPRCEITSAAANEPHRPQSASDFPRTKAERNPAAN